jgi:uncharacterized protein (TIGR02453 family)
MLQTLTLQFLKQLAKNNNKEWFDANRKKYEAAKVDFILLVQNAIDGFSKIDAAITSVSAKKSMFRINRDIRFSKDKSPYKTNFGASINPGGKISFKAGYYLHIQPGNSFVGGGIYQPMPDVLKKIRQEVDYNFEELKNIINNKKFKAVYIKGLSKEGEMSLSRPPKGYDENNPAIEFIKLKNFIVVAPLTDEQLTDKKAASTIIKAFEALYPLIVFFNKALGE